MTLDEEENLVQFAHHTIKIFLLEESNDPSLADFHFDLAHANFEAEEICVTYLSFEELKLQLAREPKIAPLANPSSILRVSLAHGFDTKISSRLMSFVTRERRDLLRMQGRILDEAMDQRAVQYAATLQETYALLAYAGGHWIFHTQEFSIEKTKCWDLWRNLLSGENAFAQTPWALHELMHRDEKVIRWTVEHDHFALLRYTKSIGESGTCMRDFLEYSTSLCHLDFLDILLKLHSFPREDINRELRHASHAGNLEVAEALLQANADLDTTDELGDTPIKSALARYDIRMMKLLIEANADQNRTDESVNMALHAATDRNDYDMVDFLLAMNADVNAPGFLGRTPLHVAAAESGQLRVVQRLLAANADVNAVDKEGWTALHLAVDRGNSAMVKLLLEAHANVDAVDKQGRTVLHLTVVRQDPELVNILLEAKADVDAADWRGRTALHIAASQQDITLVQMLLAAGADVEIVDRDGSTALDIVAESKVQMLLDTGDGAVELLDDARGSCSFKQVS